MEPCLLVLRPVRSQRGFTLNEVVVTIAVFLTASAMAISPLMSAVTFYRADGQAQRVMGLLQLARETAIMRQRDVELVADPAARRLRLVLHDGGQQTLLREVSLEYGVQFRQFDGMGAPEGLGDDGPIDFGGAPALLFISDGTLVGDDDLPVSGTIFLGIPGQPASARAVTINGATARARLYDWNNGWTQ